MTPESPIPIGPVSLGPNDEPIHVETIANRLHEIFDWMLSRHSKVYFFRFDLRFPAGGQFPTDNTHLMRFIENYSYLLRSRGLDPKYAWVREQTSLTTQQHYHLVVLLNGHRTQSVRGHLRLAADVWARTLGLPSPYDLQYDDSEVASPYAELIASAGLVDFCLRRGRQFAHENGIMIRKDRPDWRQVLAYSIDWGLYLAKQETKSFRPFGVRGFGSSRLPR
jgi:hypothetical protein